jgi:hypothetical protein
MQRTQGFLNRLKSDVIKRDNDAIILVIGDEGVGKSTFILQLVWYWQALYDNDPTSESVLDRIVHDDRNAFRRQLLESDDEQIHAAMDAAHILHKREGMQKEQIEVEKSLLDIRTFNYTILLGYQGWRDISSQLQRRRAQWAFRIPRRGVVYAYNRQQLDEKNDTGDWPKPAYKDSFFDLSDTELWQEFEERDRERKEERLELDEEPDADDVYRKEQIKTSLRAVKPWDDDGGMTYREAGKLIDYSRGWVSERMQEWKDGHYRDLIDEDEMVVA